MGRLTKKSDYGMHYFSDCFNDECSGFGSNEKCEVCGVNRKICEKLGEYEDLEEQGRLIKLPCKVGDTVYEISLVDQYRNPLIREMGVVDILLRDDDMYFTLRDLCDKDYDNSILITEFGRTVFLKKEEAEQRLKENGSLN